MSHSKMSAFFFKMAILLLQCNRLRITVNQKMKILCVTNVMVLQPNEECFSFSDDGNTGRNLQGQCMSPANYSGQQFTYSIHLAACLTSSTPAALHI